MSPIYSATTGKILLTSNSTKTLVLLNPVTNLFKIRQIDFSFDDATVASGVQMDIYRVNTLGTPTGLTATVQQFDARDTVPTTTALIATTTSGGISTEPSSVFVIASYLIQPLGGLYSIPFPYGAEIIGQGAGSRIGVRYNNPANVSTDCIVNIAFEE